MSEVYRNESPGSVSREREIIGSAEVGNGCKMRRVDAKGNDL